ncbi:hypothetical protein LXL04_001283 [Taraxacum kok-saghyz]
MSPMSMVELDLTVHQHLHIVEAIFLGFTGGDGIEIEEIPYNTWKGKQSISLEPGGQFELSGAPLETLHQTCAEVNSHLYHVKVVAEEMIGFIGIGFQPKLKCKDIPIRRKGRYEIMRNYMPKVGSLGLDMMFRLIWTSHLKRT